jgi:hypothetical protein
MELLDIGDQLRIRPLSAVVVSLLLGLAGSSTEAPTTNAVNPPAIRFSTIVQVKPMGSSSSRPKARASAAARSQVQWVRKSWTAVAAPAGSPQ